MAGEQVELVSLLTEKEVVRVKATFRELDKDRDGVVTGLEARRGVRKWCSSLNAGLSPDQVAKLSPTIDRHVEVRARMLVDGGDEQRDMITWSDFLAQQALYVLCSRPNMAPGLRDTLQHRGRHPSPQDTAHPAPHPPGHPSPQDTGHPAPHPPGHPPHHANSPSHSSTDTHPSIHPTYPIHPTAPHPDPALHRDHPEIVTLRKQSPSRRRGSFDQPDPRRQADPPRGHGPDSSPPRPGGRGQHDRKPRAPDTARAAGCPDDVHVKKAGVSPHRRQAQGQGRRQTGAGQGGAQDKVALGKTADANHHGYLDSPRWKKHVTDQHH